MDRLRTERRNIDEQIDNLTRNLVSSAKVVATMLTKCYLREEILNQYFDVVIIDEISMAQIPQLLIALGKGKQIILVGDFMQLPPIVTANTKVAKDWLGKSLYDYFNITKRFIEKSKIHNSVKPLWKQYRMHSDISFLINGLIYQGKLEDDKKTVLNRSDKAEHAPFKGHVACFNTSSWVIYRN